MNKFLKNTIVILLFVSLCVGVFGCAQNAGPSDESSDAVSEDVTVTDDGNAGEDDEADYITITDIVGREVEVKKNVERVVDISGLEAIRVLYQLGATDKLVAAPGNIKTMLSGESSFFVSESVIFPNLLDDIPDAGTGSEPNVQVIMAYEPDVIFASWMIPDMADTIQEQTSIPVVCIGDLGAMDYQILRIVGQIVGKEERAERLIEYSESKIQMVTDVVENIPEEERKTAFLWVFAQVGNSRTLVNYGPINLAGGINVADNMDYGPFDAYEISLEQIAVWNPDVIFLNSMNEYKGDAGDDEYEAAGHYTKRSILRDPILREVTAVENEDVHPVKVTASGYDTTTGVTSTLYMAKIMYPDYFKDLDVDKECNEIMIEFYGSEADGAYDALATYMNMTRWN